MQLEPMPRRRLLKLGAFSLVALGSAATFVFVRGESVEYDSAEHGRLLVLSDNNASTLLAMTQAVLPPSRATDRALHQQVISRIDEELYFVDKKIREDFCLALDVLEYLPLMSAHFSPLSKLSLVERKDYLASMQGTRSDIVRAVLHNTRLLPLYVYYGLEPSWQEIGYDGPFARMEPLMSEQRQHYADKVGSKQV